MAVVDLVNEGTQFNQPNDSLVIARNLDAVRGGGTLNVTGFTDEFIQAGHVIISDGKDYKPLGVASGAYVALTGTQKFVGVSIQTVPTNDALVGILTQGTVNPEVCKYKPTAAVLAGLPLIQFRGDF